MTPRVKQLAVDHGAIFRVLMSGPNQVVFTEDGFYGFVDDIIQGCIDECLNEGDKFKIVPQTRSAIARECVKQIIKRWREDGKA